MNPFQCVGGQLADLGSGVLQYLEQDRGNTHSIFGASNVWPP